MSSKSRHRKPSVDFIAKAQQFSQVEERLASAEHSLFEIERNLDSSPPPRMFFELGIRPSELDWISTELGEGIRSCRKRGHDETKLLNRFSRLTVAALVNAGHNTSRDNSFWPVFWEQIDVPKSPELAAFIRSKLRTWMKVFQLEVFDNISLGNAEYVMRITLHVGIPSSEMKELVMDSKTLLVDDDDPTDGDREGKLLVKRYAAQGSPRTLSRFSTHKPDLATYMFARVVEYVHYSQVVEDWYTTKEFEGTNGLPESTFNDLRQFLHQGELTASPSRRTQQKVSEEQPHLKLDPDAGKVVLVLPAVPDEGDNLSWIIDAGHDTFHIEPRFENSHRQFRREEVVLTTPTRQIHVTKSTTGETNSLRFMGADFPVAFFGPDFSFCDDQQLISRNSLFALAPVNTKFTSADGPDNNLVGEELQFITWRDWRVYTLENLLEVRAVAIQIQDSKGDVSRSTTRGIRSSGTRGPEWNDQVETVTDALGSDMGRIYSESPRITLPQDDAQWDLRISYLSLLGEKSLVLEYEDLQEFAGEEFSIFDDSFGEPWVGRFLIELIKDGLVVDQKSFNIAEGLKINVSYASADSFRYPDINLASNRYGKVYFEAMSNFEKPIHVPFTGTKAIGDTEESELFVVSSPEGYELEVQLVPKLLRFSIDRTDIPHSWNTFPCIIPSRYVDDSGQVKIQFPRRVEGAVVLLVADSRARNKLVKIPMQARRNRHLFAVPVSELKSAFGAEVHSLTLSVGWYNQTVRELWTSQKKSRQTSNGADSFAQFEKAYNSFLLSPSASNSTIMQLSSSVFSGTAGIKDSTVSLYGSTLGKSTLRGHLWPITAANAKPQTISFDANEQATLPESLIGAGPLALEITAQDRSYQNHIPTIPTGRAIIINQPGYFIEPMDDGSGNLWGLSYKLSGISTAPTASPNEFVDLWERLAPLRNIDFRSHAARIVLENLEKFCQRSFDQDPRAILEALGRSNVRVELQIGLSIRFGLFHHIFRNQQDTLDEFHPVPWVGVLGEMNDLVALSYSGHSSRRSVEFSDSLQFVQETGGEPLSEILGGSYATEQEFVERVLGDVSYCIMLEDYSQTISGLSDINSERLLTDEVAIRHGWAELLRNREEIERIHGLKYLKDLAIKLIPNIEQPEVHSYATRLSRFAEEHSDPHTNLWTWVPTISVVLSHVSRCHAHGVSGAFERFYKLESGTLRRWAAIAALCPTMTTNDLLREDARQLTVSNGPLPEIQSASRQ